MKNAPVLHRIEYGLFSALRRVLGWLPHRTSRLVGRMMGELIWIVLGSRRKTALANLELVFPERSAGERRRVAHASFRHLGEMTGDTVSTARFDAVDLCDRMTIEGWEHLDAGLGAGHGVLMMSAHLGSWEIAALPTGLYRQTMHVIGRPLDNPWLNRHLEWARTRFGNATIPKHGAARGALRVLRQGGIVGILIDQRVRPEQGILVPFMGHPAITSPLLARLALKTGAPVVPIFGHLEPGGRYRVHFEEPLWATDDGPEPAAEFTRRCLEVVEEQIRLRPETWLWLHRRWKR